MKAFEKINITKGVDLVSVWADRFKTNEFAVSFCTALTEKNASSNALLISLLSHCSEEYPDMMQLNKKLSYLYGASLYSSVQKIGENQVLSLQLTGLDDRFSLMGGKISNECVELLMSLIFNPRLDSDGNFFDEDINMEKRLLIEKIESEENEKRIYALRQTEKAMFKNEPYSVNRFGNVQDIEKLTKEDLKRSWNFLLRNSKIQFTVVGTADKDELKDMINEKFSSMGRDYNEPEQSVFIPSAEKINKVEERIDVKQGKLVLGFRVNMKSDDEKAPAMRAFSDVFGGGPYSKLFANVREKLSLCYYCSARYDRRKSCILIQCGCEEENMDKAVDEIMSQLSEIQKGNFDEEFNSSKIGLSDIINSSEDDSAVLLNWYLSQIADGDMKSPKQSADENNAVTKEDIKYCSSLLTLDTIYKLTGNKEGE